jgi:hypothetical protein
MLRLIPGFARCLMAQQRCVKMQPQGKGQRRRLDLPGAAHLVVATGVADLDELAVVFGAIDGRLDTPVGKQAAGRGDNPDADRAAPRVPGVHRRVPVAVDAQRCRGLRRNAALSTPPALHADLPNLHPIIAPAMGKGGVRRLGVLRR